MALEVFAESQDDWEWYFPPMGGNPIRLKLKLGDVRDTADSHGLTWNHELVRRLKACARVVVTEERSSSERKSKAKKKKPRRSAENG